MTKKTLLISALILTGLSTACAERDADIPRVISTSPANMSRDVDPSLTEISVTFSEAMMDGSWSWAYEDRNTFPVTTGQAYYVDDNTKNILPVTLEPGKEYVVWINTKNFTGFKDKSGNSAVPFRFTFSTGQSPQ